MKHEWRKHEKPLYLPKQTPTLITVPKQKFLLIKGQGNPNGETFARKVEALYSHAYTIKMMPRKGIKPAGYFEYTVYPLEGIWDLTEKGRKETKLNKDELAYTLMIRQPDFVDQTTFATAAELVREKNTIALAHEVTLGEIKDGLCVQIMHRGPFDTEPESFAKIKTYLAENALERTTLIHREIYLSDPRKTAPASLKTVLRCFVRPKNNPGNPPPPAE